MLRHAIAGEALMKKIQINKQCQGQTHRHWSMDQETEHSGHSNNTGEKVQKLGKIRRA